MLKIGDKALWLTKGKQGDDNKYVECVIKEYLGDAYRVKFTNTSTLKHEVLAAWAVHKDTPINRLLHNYKGN